jgi:complement component 1 Q subcomponent-binding protein
MEGQSGGANTKGAVNQGRTSGGNMRVAPDDDVTPADRPELQDEESDSDSFPARVQVTVTREGKGALAIECLAQDGEISIENVYHFPSAELAEAKTAEKDWARRSLYTGPPFGQLDEDLQMLLERFLEERGINTQMALFIPEYIDLKEQKEYIGWLNSKLCPMTNHALVSLC